MKKTYQKNMVGDILDKVVEEVFEIYGLKNRGKSKPTEEEEKKSLLETLLKGYREAKKYGFDVESILEKHEEIKAYMESTGIKPVKKRFQDPKINYSDTLQFVLRSIKAVQFEDYFQEKSDEAERIKGMTDKEWLDTYHGGNVLNIVRCGYMTNRETHYKTLEKMAEEERERLYDEINSIYGSEGVRDHQLVEAMRQAPVVRDLLDKYVLKEDSYESYHFNPWNHRDQERQRYMQASGNLNIDSAELVPKEQN